MPSPTFQIFVSTTFSDLKEERNALQERVFPRLREFCQFHGARFQVIDLRWGVSEEASVNQQTMKICLGEIERCQKTTPRPNFIVLLGDRYGWRPLPSEIPETEFVEILKRVTSPEKELLCWSEDQPQNKKGWYRRDNSSDKTLRLWDPSSGKPLITLTGHRGPVQSCAFSPDGRLIVSGSWDKTLKLWDAKTGENLSTMAGHAGWVQQVMFSPNRKWILSRAVDRTIKLWNTEKGTLQTTFVHQDLIENCAFSPTDDKIVCGCGDKLILWNLETQSSMILTGHKGTIFCCAFSQDGSKIVSGSADHTLKLWNTITGKELASFKGHEGWVLICALSPDGTQLISGSNDNLLKLWDIASGKELCKYWAGIAVQSVTWHPSGESIAAGDGTGNHHLVQVQAGRLSD